MEAYKQEFIKFMVESDVLKFGSFTLKSGRQSPVFMNAGAYVTGYQLKKLGEYYAQAIHDNFGDDFDVLFGPAYKGIPLAVVTAIAYHELYGKEVKYCCDREWILYRKQRIRLLRFSNLSIPDSQISPISQFQENRHNNAVARDSCFATRKFFR